MIRGTRAVLAAALVLAAFSSGCAGGDDTPSPAAAPSAAPTGSEAPTGPGSASSAPAASGTSATTAVPAVSGNVASQRFDLPGVTRLEVGSAFDVRLSLGQPEQATVFYDQALADRLDVAVEGTTFRIGLRSPSTIRDSPTLRAELTVGRLDSVQLSGASSLEVSGEVQGARLDVELSGSSRLAGATALERIRTVVSGASRLELSGRAGTLEATASGSSDLELARLTLGELDIELSGASHADVDVNGAIAAQLSGASQLAYRGNPQFTRRDTSGGSSIRPA